MEEKYGGGGACPWVADRRWLPIGEQRVDVINVRLPLIAAIHPLTRPLMWPAIYCQQPKTDVAGPSYWMAMVRMQPVCGVVWCTT